MYYPPMFYFSAKEPEEQKPAQDEDVTPLKSNHLQESIKAAFDAAREQDVNEHIALFVPAARHIIDILNRQEGLTATLSNYYLKTYRDAPLSADLSAYGDKVTEYKGLGYSSIYGSACLQLTIALQHDDANILLKSLTGKQPENKHMNIWLIDDGRGNAKFAEDVSRYDDPNNALDIFSTIAENTIIKKAENALSRYITESIQTVKQEEALGMTQTKRLPHKPARKVVLK